MSKKIVLAYSGGLDTSVAIKWLADKYGAEIVAFSVNIGAVKDLEQIKEKALKVGAVKAYIQDATETFIKSFVFPALKANALYEGEYPLATALGRPLMAKLLVDAARKEGAFAVAHGSTGKGNDQVRFDVCVAALAPELQILAPAREWKMTREELIKYADKYNIPVPITKASPYSIDENIWGRSCECGVLEDPWVEPPGDAYSWTKPIESTPNKPTYVEIMFEKGIPIGMNEKKMRPVRLIEQLNKIAGNNGIGRIDHIESRLVGIKSRETYEAPAAIVMIKAHKALEALTLAKDQLRFKEKVAIEYSDLVYNGLWFTAYRQDLAAYVDSTQRFVTGVVRLKLFKGNCIVVGRKSPYSIYNLELATYDKGDQFDQSAAPGFIHIWGLPVRTQAKAQGSTSDADKYKFKE
jgi:argininosuccinate synthase